MRPLEEVLTQVQAFPLIHPDADCSMCARYRRELEEWEAKLAGPLYGSSLKENLQLEEVRRLLSGAPEHEQIVTVTEVRKGQPRKYDLDDFEPPAPSAAFRAVTKALEEVMSASAALMRAIEASGYVSQVMDELEPGYDGFGKRAAQALALARAELESTGRETGGEG